MVLNMAFANNLKQAKKGEAAAISKKIRGISINKLHRACSSGITLLYSLFVI